MAVNSWLNELKEPVIFDQLNNVRGKPNLTSMYRSANLTSWCFFRRNSDNTGYDYDAGLDEAVMKRVLPRIRRNYPRALFTIDIEHWALHRDYGQALEGLKIYHKACELSTRIFYDAAHPEFEGNFTYEQAVSEYPLGYYRLFPTRDYEAFNDPKTLARWEMRNDHNLNVMRPVLGYMAPCLYYIERWTPDFAAWKLFAQHNLEEARRVAPEYPLLAWLSPRVYPFGPTSPLKEENLFKDMLNWTLDQGVHVICYDSTAQWELTGGYAALVSVLKERYGAIIHGLDVAETAMFEPGDDYVPLEEESQME